MDKIIEKAISIYKEGLDYVIELSSLRIVWASDKTIQESGYSREKFLKMRIPDIVPPEEIEKFKKDLSERLIKKQGTAWFIRQVNNNKKVRVLIDYQIFDHDGNSWMAAKILDADHLN